MSSTINAVNNSLTLQTGTGNFVGSTSPTIVTPKIGTIDDTNGNAALSLTATTSAVNYFNMVNAATAAFPGLFAVGSDTNIGMYLVTKGTSAITLYSGGGSNVLAAFPATASSVNYLQIYSSATATNPGVNATGSDSNVTMQLSGKGTGGVTVQGTSAGGNAAAGYVGEFITSQIAFASAISFTNATAKNLTSISLTAGDWDVSGNFGANSTVYITVAIGGISTTTGTLPDASLSSYTQNAASISAISIAASPTQRISVSSTTTVYLVGYIAGSGTLTGYGFISARRVR